MYITELPLHNSVRIGELCYPAKDLESIAARSVRLLTFEFDEYVGFRGSCTLVKLRGRKFAVATRHQLGIPNGFEFSDKELGSVRITALRNGKLENILIDQCIFESANPEQDYHDLIVFRVAEDSVQTGPEPFSFFPIFEIKNCYYLSSFAVGYPSFANEINYDVPLLKSASAIRSCRRDRSFRSGSDFLNRFVHEDEAFDFDGFSGGAVFSLLKNAGGYEIGLEGIIVRGGHGSIYAIDSHFLMRLARFTGMRIALGNL